LDAGYGVYRSRESDTIERVAPILTDGRPHEPSLLGTLREVAAALDEGRRPQSDARDNLRTLVMAFAVGQSARDRPIVDLAHR